jgi:hypothetical protein
MYVVRRPTGDLGKRGLIIAWLIVSRRGVAGSVNLGAARPGEPYLNK